MHDWNPKLHGVSTDGASRGPTGPLEPERVWPQLARVLQVLGALRHSVAVLITSA